MYLLTVSPPEPGQAKVSIYIEIMFDTTTESKHASMSTSAASRLQASDAEQRTLASLVAQM